MDKTLGDDLIDLISNHSIWLASQTSCGHRLQLVNQKITDVKLSNARLSQSDLRGSKFDSTNLNGADLSGANLRGVSFCKSSLVGSNLKGADLSSACLLGCNLQSANLDGAILRGANFAGANLNQVTISEKTRLNWDSHDLIAAVLQTECRGEIEKEKCVGYILINRQKCWADFLNISDNVRAWAIAVLMRYAQKDPGAPSELFAVAGMS